MGDVDVRVKKAADRFHASHREEIWDDSRTGVASRERAERRLIDDVTDTYQDWLKEND